MVDRERWHATWLDHPQLPLVLVLDEGGALVHLGFSLETRPRFDDLRAHAERHGAELRHEPGPGRDEALGQLRQYLAGRRRDFALPLRLLGTEFQRRAWQALLEIPFGQTRSYGQQAEALGQPGAARAVGHANGQNPVSVVVPCHRVVGADGKLTGFGGGIEAKRWLLELERRGVTPAWSPRPGPRRPVDDDEAQLELVPR